MSSEGKLKRTDQPSKRNTELFPKSKSTKKKSTKKKSTEKHSTKKKSTEKHSTKKKSTEKHSKKHHHSSSSLSKKSNTKKKNSDNGSDNSSSESSNDSKESKSSGSGSKDSKESSKSEKSERSKEELKQEKKVLDEAIKKRSEARAADNAWWEARRESAREWGSDKGAGSKKCLIIGGLQCGSRAIIQHLVTGAASGVADESLDGLIISPHERMDPILKTRYPKMRWCKFFGNEAMGYWRALNARGTPFYVLVSGGILGSHIDDDLIETIDKNRGTLIIHQTVANMLDSVFNFDRILANADRKSLYPLCQEFVEDMGTWDRYMEALLCDEKLFLDIIRAEKRMSIFRLKV